MNHLSENCRKHLKSSGLSVEDQEVFTNPNINRVIAFIHKVHQIGYDEGYHRAIEDMKELAHCKVAHGH